MLKIIIIFCLSCGCAVASEVDPWESWNRKVFALNEVADGALLKPLAKGYKTITPDFVQSGISNFFTNLTAIWSAVNQVLQLKPKEAVNDVMRFSINSTFGIFGLIDLATPIGLNKNQGNFSQTLGVWGVPDGNYLVLPILGPSTVRSGLTSLVDLPGSLPLKFQEKSVSYQVSGLNLLQKRAKILTFEEDFQNVQALSLDKYIFIRESYFQLKNKDKYDGNLPNEDESP